MMAVLAPPELVLEDGADVAAGVVQVHPRAATGYQYRIPEEPAQVQGPAEQEDSTLVAATVRMGFGLGNPVVGIVVD